MIPMGPFHLRVFYDSTNVKSGWEISQLSGSAQNGAEPQHGEHTFLHSSKRALQLITPQMGDARREEGMNAGLSPHSAPCWLGAIGRSSFHKGINEEEELRKAAGCIAVALRAAAP